jgi:hypothetical protein
MTVHAFPTAKHSRMVDTIGRGMAAAGSMDAAEEYLVDHLCIHFDRLEMFGVGESEAEKECIAFARAAWRRFEQLQHEVGAA